MLTQRTTDSTPMYKSRSVCVCKEHTLASSDQHPALIKSAPALQTACVSAVSGICSCQKFGVACEATSFAFLWSHESLSLAPIKNSCLGHCLATRRTTVYPRPLPGAAPAFALARAATALPLPPTPMGTFFICRPEVN